VSPLGNLVVLWGGGLLVANVLFDPMFYTLRAGVAGGTTSASDLTSTPLKMVLMGLLTLVVASFLAERDPRAAKAILAGLAGLTILWLINYNQQKASGALALPGLPTGTGASTTTPSSTSPPTTKSPTTKTTSPKTASSPCKKGQTGTVVINGKTWLCVDGKLTPSGPLQVD
jgi:hypothetical protein